MTNLQEKRLVISRMEVVPPSAALPPPGASATTTTTPTAAAAGAAASSTAATGTDGAGSAVKWATLPNGPILHDENAAAAAVVALPGTGDSCTYCFSAKGYAERPAPLGKLRVTWRPSPEGVAAARAAGDGGSNAAMLPPPDETAAEGAAVTEFPLPVLSARPPALSARLKAPPHARVGEEFSMR